MALGTTKRLQVAARTRRAEKVGCTRELCMSHSSIVYRRAAQEVKTEVLDDLPMD